LHVFFYVIPLLLLPLIYNIYIKLLNSFYDRNIENFSKYLNIFGSEKDANGVFLNFTFSFKPDYSKNTKNVLDELVTGWLLLTRIQHHVDIIRKNKDYYYPYISLLTTIFYILGSGYRLYFYLS
jgi:hypothetical protein